MQQKHTPLKFSKSLTSKTRVLGAILLVGFTLTTLSLQAKEIKDPAMIAAKAKSSGLITLEEAKQKALIAKPGNVKGIELEKRKKSEDWHYEVEIVDAKGQEWDVELDAKTGAILKVELD